MMSNKGRGDGVTQPSMSQPWGGMRGPGFLGGAMGGRPPHYGGMGGDPGAGRYPGTSGIPSMTAPAPIWNGGKPAQQEMPSGFLGGSVQWGGGPDMGTPPGAPGFLGGPGMSTPPGQGSLISPPTPQPSLLTMQPPGQGGLMPPQPGMQPPGFLGGAYGQPQPKQPWPVTDNPGFLGGAYKWGGGR